MEDRAGPERRWSVREIEANTSQRKRSWTYATRDEADQRKRTMEREEREATERGERATHALTYYIAELPPDAPVVTYGTIDTARQARLWAQRVERTGIMPMREMKGAINDAGLEDVGRAPDDDETTE